MRLHFCVGSRAWMRRSLTRRFASASPGGSPHSGIQGETNPLSLRERAGVREQRLPPHSAPNSAPNARARPATTAQG